MSELVSGGSISGAEPDVEGLILATCLRYATGLTSVVGAGVRPTDFVFDTHRIIFECMMSLQRQGLLIDLVTLKSELSESGLLELIGGDSYVNRLAELSVDDSFIGSYCSIVRDRSVRRSLRDAVEDVIRFSDSEPDVKKVVEYAEDSVFRVGESLLVGDASRGVRIGELERFVRSQEHVSRVPYPFEGLNTVLGGRPRGALTVWGGYSSDGKSIVGMQSALAAAHKGYRVGFFSLEMTEDELLFRILSMLTGISTERIEYDDFSAGERLVVDKALRVINGWDMTIYCSPSISPAEIRARQMKERFDLVVVDYLQRFPFTDWQEIPRMAKSFKDLALTTKCCIDVLSQLTPQQAGPNSNPFSRPNMNSLYGGKATGHEANNVIFVWAQREAPNWSRTGHGQIVVAKARGGRGEFSFSVELDTDRVMWREFGDVEEVLDLYPDDFGQGELFEGESTVGEEVVQ